MIDLVQKASTQGSVLTPLLWACGALYTFTIAMYGVVGGVPAHMVLALAIGMTGYLAFYYSFWQRRDPDRLHTEAHIQAMRRLDVMGDSNHGPMIDAEPVPNPYIGQQDEH